MMRPLAATLLLALTLASCSVLPKPAVETRYTLTPGIPNAEIASTTGSPSSLKPDPNRTLRIARPDVPLPFRSNQLVLIKNGEQTVYAGKAWDAPVPDMLAAALNRDLSAAMPNWIVSSETSGVRSAYELQTEVRTFATVQNDRQYTVVVNLDLRFVNLATRKVEKRIPFHFAQSLPTLTTEETIKAYNQAWQTLLPQIALLISGN